MRGLVRIGALVALVGAQLVLVPTAVRAQVPDPCSPVPVPGLCPTPAPIPSPPGTDPSPGGGGGGGGGGKSGGGGQPSNNKPKAGKANRSENFAVSGPNSTARLIELVTPLVRKGADLQELLLDVVGPFPIAGPAWWTNDWHACRDGCTRLHKGLDIFAPHGTPLVAAASGVLSQKGAGGLCGIFVEITDAKGIQYFYCHMSAHAPGLRVGQQVNVGDPVGFVGNTGNAISTPSHVHFEYQPNGVAAPPKPHVDRWTKLAERNALALLKEHGIELPAADQGLQFRLTRLFDLAGSGGQVPQTADSLLLLTGLQPAASGLDLAHRTPGQMAWEIDWSGHVNGQLAAVVADYRAYLIGNEMMGFSPWPFESRKPTTSGSLDGSD